MKGGLGTMLNFAAISGLTVIWTLGAILLVVAVWLIIKMTLEEPGKNQSSIDLIRKRYLKGEIGDDNYDERLHHLI
jgi:uncharacterized membrane protein